MQPLTEQAGDLAMEILEVAAQYGVDRNVEARMCAKHWESGNFAEAQRIWTMVMTDLAI